MTSEMARKDDEVGFRLRLREDFKSILAPQRKDDQSGKNEDGGFRLKIRRDFLSVIE